MTKMANLTCSALVYCLLFFTISAIHAATPEGSVFTTRSNHKVNRNLRRLALTDGNYDENLLHIRCLKRYLEAGGNLNTPLPEPAWRCMHLNFSEPNLLEGLLESLRQLFDRQHYLSIQIQKEERLPIMIAVRSKRNDVLKFLLDKGVDVNVGKGTTPLIESIERNDTKKVEMLLQAGALPLLCGEYVSTNPVSIAIMKGNLDIVKLLVARVGVPDFEVSFGWLPLAEAVERGKVRIVEYFLQAGAAIDQTVRDGETALHKAVKLRDQSVYSEIIEQLLSHGARVDIQDLYGNTPLMYAVRLNNLGAAALLSYYGANASISNMYGDTPRDYGGSSFWDGLDREAFLRSRSKSANK